jgi:hypothetical protein
MSAPLPLPPVRCAVSVQMNFYNWSCLWMLRLLDTEPALFGALPESILENAIEFYAFIGKFHSKMLTAIADKAKPSGHASSSSRTGAGAGGGGAGGDEQPSGGVSGGNDRTDGLFALMMAVMSGPHALKNSAVRGHMAEILTLFIPEEDRRAMATPEYNSVRRLRPAAHHVFFTDPVLVRRLVPSLLELYCDIEFGPNAYYEKFNTRHLIAELLEFLWEFPPHQKALIALAQTQTKPAAASAADSKSASASATATVSATAAPAPSPSPPVSGSASGGGASEVFTRFVNFVLNDWMYLLDQGLTSLTEVRNQQVERRDDAKWRAQPPNGTA